MTSDFNNKTALNVAMREAVDFIHAEGWDRPATLFALVPHALLPEAYHDEENTSPLALVVQEDLPSHIRPGSEELGEFIATLRWPETVVGVVLAQEIMFRNSAENATSDEPQPARLYSGVLRTGEEQTFIQLRPTDEQLESDLFAQDKIELLGGEDIAPGVTAVLHACLQEDLPD